eukprot:PhM_4_TR6317/c2_g1_i1/m.48322/K15272/SLC35A1_2_3; solute carrier family 35 (UDP-sugar transporter), member A1/2/3
MTTRRSHINHYYHHHHLQTTTSSASPSISNNSNSSNINNNTGTGSPSSASPTTMSCGGGGGNHVAVQIVDTNLASSSSSTPPVASSSLLFDNNTNNNNINNNVQHVQMCGVSLRYLSLFALIFQNCAAVLLIRYTQQVSNPSAIKYEPATLVAITEVLKYLLCACIITYDEGLANGAATIYRHSTSVDSLKLAVPAALYTLQNNLLFTALANLEATLFQVTYQLKVLTTALLMVMLLGRRLSRLKWLSLIILFVGVVFTQLQGQKVSTAKLTVYNLVTGLTAVVVCSLSSSFASVYFEKILKTVGGQTQSLWIRNIQLANFSFVFSMGTVFWRSGTLVGFFTGYYPLTWMLVFVQVFGGILVAVVMKYADNILKGFATSIAIIVSGVISYVFLDFMPTWYFAFGAGTVIAAVMLYSLPDPPAPATSPV